MTDEQERLVLENQGLIGTIIKKFNLTYDYNEFWSIGMVGLCKGAKNFDKNKGKSSTYLGRCIQNEILMALRKRRFDVISLDEIIKDKITIVDTIADDTELEEEIIKRDEIDLIKKALNILNEKERYAVQHYFEINGACKLNQKQLACKLGVAQGYASKLLNKSILKIQKKVKQLY